MTYPETHALSPMPEATPAPTRPNKRAIGPWILFLSALLVGSVVVTVVLLTRGDSSAPAFPTALEKVSQACDLPSSYATIGDGGRTLTVRGAGEKKNGLTWTQIGCVLDSTKMPDSVRGQFDSTRALDGMQSASWNNYSATWNYHPDSGVNLVITSR
jgi:hypothetical protein